MAQTAAEFEKLGDDYANKQDYLNALRSYMESRKLNMGNAVIYLKLGKAFIKLKNYKEAERALLILQKGEKIITEARILYAQAILMQGKTTRAREILDDVLQHNIPDYDHYIALQVYLIIHSESGDQDKTIETAEKILEISPNNYPTLLRLLSHKKGTELDDEFLHKYEKIADKIKGLNNHDEDLFFALARAFEHRKDYKKSVKYAKRANAIYGYRHKFETEQRTALTKSLVQTFTKEFFASHADCGDKSAKPIFIIGMPRSSTSLTEQILASHSKVTACGELYTLGEFSVSHEAITKLCTTFPEGIGAISSEQVRKLAEDYYKDIESKGYQPTDTIITDKMPTNFFYVGLIALMFPNAKIINCVRDLRDVAISNYTQKFNVGNYWAQSFTDIIKMSSLYRELINHWKESSPIEIYDINYQSLLDSPEEETRKLLAHCELDWEESCMKFYETKRTVQTASMSQVKQPLFKSSLGKWKNYEQYFGKELMKLDKLNS